MGSLDGRLALVTGGTRSLGRAISIALAEAGAEVTATYLTRPGEPFPKGLSIWHGRLDVRKPPAELGWAYDILVNNAGITAGRSIPKTLEADWLNVIDTNLSGPWRMMHLSLPWMIEHGWGRVINITSVVGMDGRFGPAPYAASKAGVIGLTKAAAHEMAGKGITVNAIAAGFIEETGMVSRLTDAQVEQVEQAIPAGTLGTVRDISDAVVYLCQAPYVTGQVFNVSGGYLT